MQRTPIRGDKTTNLPAENARLPIKIDKPPVQEVYVGQNCAQFCKLHGFDYVLKVDIFSAFVPVSHVALATNNSTRILIFTLGMKYSELGKWLRVVAILDETSVQCTRIMSPYILSLLNVETLLFARPE